MTGPAEVLRGRGLCPKRSFGQNFLHDIHTAERIAEAAVAGDVGAVLEIGAGLGALTAPLRARGVRVVAVERDRDLVPILRERFGDEVQVLEADAATLDWPAALAPYPGPHVVVGNLPYAITGRLLRRAVVHAGALGRVVFMVQREVADRLCAAPGGRTYGALSVFAQAAFEVRRLLKVGPGAFYPRPRVSSAVVVLTPLAPPQAEETEVFRQVVRLAFQGRRKTLRNAWQGLGLPRSALLACAERAGVRLGARAETLAVARFGAMAQQVAAARGEG